MFPYQSKVYNLRFLLESQYWSLEKLQELQLNGFKAITNFARENCRYYRDLPTVKDIDDVKNIPILTKTDIKNNFNDIIVSGVPHEIEETGGTVSRIRVARDKILLGQLSLKRFETWYRMPIGRTAHLWGSVEGKSFVYDNKSLWMPVELLNNKSIAEKYLRALVNMKPDMLHGYALPLATLAHYANELNIHPFCKVVRSECETLTSSMREEIEKAFKTKYGLFNLYGSRDLGGMAQDCERHEGLHLFAERYITEVVDGRFLFTDMINYSFPLIRYENQDIGEFTDKPCKCGRGLPTIKPVVGRILHYLVTKKNKWVTAFIFYLPINYYDIHHETKFFSWIESFQIRQREVGKVTLLFKPWNEMETPKNWNDITRILKQYISKEDFDFDIEIVDKIPLSVSGKQISVDTTLMREWK